MKKNHMYMKNVHMVLFFRQKGLSYTFVEVVLNKCRDDGVHKKITSLFCG